MPGRKRAGISAKNLKSHDAAFSLFMLGILIKDISAQVKVPVSTIEKWHQKECWFDQRERVYAKRNERLGAKVLAEQETIKGQERDFAEKLMVAATMALKHFNAKKCKPGDLVKILDLASKLSRLSAGMPLGAAVMDVAVRHDLGDSIKAALAKVYGDQPQLQKPIEVVSEPIVDNNHT